MFGYKFCVITCFEVLLFSFIACEIFQCSDPSSLSCVIDDIDSTEPTEFLLQNHYNQHSINELKFINSRVSYIPHGIFLYLPYLRTLDLSDCHLLEILRFDFVKADQLFDIDLSYNHLAELKESIFYGANNVERINLTNNQINHIAPYTFKNLNRLTRINLSHNDLHVLGPNVFSNLAALRYIDLSANVLEALDAPDVFTNLNLTELDLSNNRIVTIGERIFMDVKFIKLLNLNYNSVNNFSVGDVTINIESISIQHNNLTVLETNSNLRMLEASNNRLTNANLHIGHYLTQLVLINNLLSNLDFIKSSTNLRYLDVSINPLEDQISSDTFTQLINLVSLSLESVNLRRIDFQIFSTLEQLVILDISYNDLDAINFHTLSFLEKLTYLYIDGNRLTKLEADDFIYLFPNLKRIGISENNWPCDDLIVILKRFKELNIEIYLDDSRVTKNSTNIRGIKCYNEKSALNIENTSPKFPLIHNHTVPNTNYIFEINENRVQLNRLQVENEHLKFEVNQLRTILTNMTSNDFEKYAKEINDQITNLTETYRSQMDSINVRLNTQSDHRTKTLSTNDQDVGYLSICSDMKFIKIVFIVAIMVGVILGLIKVYKMLRYRRSYRPSYNTMTTVLNESNI